MGYSGSDLITVANILILILIAPPGFQLNSCESAEENGILREPMDLKTLRTTTLPRTSRAFSHPKVYRCDDEGKDLVVNFVNLNYPDNDMSGSECNFRMIITSPQICQVRVDFVDTEMLRPVRGECLSQLFEVEGALWPTGLPPMCGKQNDQHFYLHLEQWSTNTTFLDFKLTTVVGGEAYRFGVWLTQIDCSTFNVLKAPEGCTQYFLGEKGIIKSFNFEGSRYLNGQDYQICIRPAKSVCGIRYEAVHGEFSMRKSVRSTKDVYLKSGTGSPTCGMDYVLIPDGKPVSTKNHRNGRLFFKRRPPAAAAAPPSLTKSKKPELKTTFDRFCGGKFAPITGEAKNKPIFAKVRSNLITLRVKTSHLLEAQALRQNPGLNSTVGFRLSYQQVKDCDKNDTDLAGPSSANNLIKRYGPDNHGPNAPALFRNGLEPSENIDSLGAQHLIASIIAAPDANASLLNRFTNSSVEASETDSIWDYLDSSEESGSENDDDLYDFL